MATGPAVPVPHRPHKLLILSDGNWNFLGPTIDAFSADPEVELRCAEVSRLRGSALIDTSRLFAPQNDVVADIADMNARLKQDAPEIHELIEWADTIFVEWCSVTAVWASRYLPLDKRLVIRMHGSEVFSVWPAFVNWGRVDALITVAPFMRDFATRKFGLEAFGHLDRPVFSNVTDIARFPADKTAAADHTLGMIGYNTANKNARIALDVLTELRRDSDIWQLKLIGGDFPDHEQAAKQAFEATLAADPDLRGNVIFTGFTKTPETEFPDVGYLLSLSDREGCHTAVMEGMASGAVPVILDWHLLRKWNAARALYGDQYVVDTPQQVAARIREIAEAGTRAQLGQKAQTEAFEKFDFNSVWPAFRQTILG